MTFRQRPARCNFGLDLGLLLASAMAAALAACNDCDFLEKRCNGNVVEQCGHSDQQVGRTIMRTTCEGLNPVCVRQGDDAFCAVSAEGTCTPGNGRCDGNTRLQCRAPGVEVATDCSKVQEFVVGQGLVPGDFVCRGPTGAAPADCYKR